MPQPSNNSAMIMQINPNSPISEAYRSLRFNIEFSVIDREVKTLTITSASRGEGKTTTALNLAVAYAQTGKRVVLLDADLRKPSIHLAFSRDNSSGLTTFLTNQMAVEDLIRESNVENLSIVTSGPVPSNPLELLASKRMGTLFSELRQKYDMVIFDTPPVLTLADAKIMAAKSDGVLLVVEYGKVKRSAAKKVREELMLAKANLMGVVWNKIKNQTAEAYLYE